MQQEIETASHFAARFQNIAKLRDVALKADDFFRVIRFLRVDGDFLQQARLINLRVHIGQNFFHPFAEPRLVMRRDRILQGFESLDFFRQEIETRRQIHSQIRALRFPHFDKGGDRFLRRFLGERQ